jgi:hypothetical protein
MSEFKKQYCFKNHELSCDLPYKTADENFPMLDKQEQI